MRPPVEDMAPVEDMGGGGGGCMPACSATQRCLNGSCVDVCGDCEAPGTCTPNGCSYPDCSQAGDRCDETRGDQGQFWCVSAGGKGYCRAKCDEAFAASSCSTGHYCRELGAAALVCLPAACQADVDCPNAGGTCLNFDNDYGLCLTTGNLAVGASCDTSRNDCVQGAVCTKLDAAAPQGTCRRLCDPWAATTGCGVGERCAHLASSREGICTSDLDAMGRAPFDQCTTPGAVCDDATRCLANNRCYRYCRADRNDCGGVIINGRQTVCDRYAFLAEKSFGVCQPPCRAQTECPNGFVCDTNAGLCREVCSVPADCCPSGMPDCGESCTMGLCE